MAATTAQWQTYKSDASQAGIDINIVGQSFNTIIGQSAPCSPMSAKCAVQVFAFGGWVFNGPGFEPTGEPLFATGAGSNSGNYSDPKMDNLITGTHNDSAMSAFVDYATYGAQQLPFIWAPQTTRTSTQSTASCTTSPSTRCTRCFPSTGTSPASSGARPARPPRSCAPRGGRAAACSMTGRRPVCRARVSRLSSLLHGSTMVVGC